MRTKTPQELYWEGQKGDEWFTRNQLEASSRSAFFRNVLSKTFGVVQICELGCGQGHNLSAIGELSKNYRLTGVELNEVALSLLKKQERIRSFGSSIQDFVTDERFDLVFVSGVLIHVSEDLPKVYAKMDELSSRYVLICEYFNPVPVEVSYHDQKGLLIKRDFAKEFLEATNGAYAVVDYGFIWRQQDPAWDNINWTLLEKPEH